MLAFTRADLNTTVLFIARSWSWEDVDLFITEYINTVLDYNLKLECGPFEEKNWRSVFFPI